MENELRDVGLHSDGSFRFLIPATFKKSRDGKIEIEGVASIETPDLQGETLLLRGMDLNCFTVRGYFNDNHSRDTEGKVGVPTEARVIRDGSTQKAYVKGYRLDTPRAEGIVRLAEVLQKSGNTRRLGFSIEGKEKERDGRIVSKSRLKDIAFTFEPIHPEQVGAFPRNRWSQSSEYAYLSQHREKPVRPGRRRGVF